MKNYWSALLVIIASALVYHLLEKLIPGGFGWILTLVYCILLLVIGGFLLPGRKKNNRWFGKVVISLIVVFIMGIRLDIFGVYEFQRLLNLVGLNGVFLDLLLVYCGWAFYQV
ncbi:hypothetical protein AOC36_01730 [Erysipelothrix larvae]|uniref:Uncharacterized protein n=1 Tax=Erysipelothrix larvae TaxID=1514105 RepID=A0A0X8GYG7_9FIRM|nr:hypothetical protein [Erysipelothrix larvae]AMC92750.1 hypothetical protein AOC36_01730 [Erysipelothrix larvae]